MRCTQRRDDPGDDLIDGLHDRIDHHMRLAIVRLALAIQLLDLLEPPAVEHRTLSRPARPLVELAQIATQPDDGAELPQCFHAPLAACEAAARRDDVAGLQAERVQRFRFELPESLLAVLAKNVRNRAAL